MSEKRRALLAQKQKILEDIKYYENRIENAQIKKDYSNHNVDESSDSDTDLISLIDLGPSITQLKLQRSMLQTCHQATQELTSLQVLQSEVNVLTNDPEISGTTIKEQGTWRDVTAECKVDLVPFSIIYYAFQPNRKFAGTSYRGLTVTPVKKAHEVELSKSVLPGLTKPSDAVEVLKSYAVAHRSRRTTLAHLAETFANILHMEPNPEGGYVLKCADLLEMSWCLQNKWSPIAPFHHKMKFDLEYMDESYIKIITLAHRQLSDPSVETDERTLLLTKIINTCLEAQGPTKELYESMESDPEVAKAIPTLRKRRTTLDQEPEMPVMKRQKENEIMAPPKTVPKKTKPKGKENNVANENAKRPADRVDDNAKKVKTSDAHKVNDIDRVDKANDLGADEALVETVEEIVKKPANKSDKSKNTNNDNGKKDGDDTTDKNKDAINKTAAGKAKKSVAVSKKNENENVNKEVPKDITVEKAVEKNKADLNKDHIKNIKENAKRKLTDEAGNAAKKSNAANLITKNSCKTNVVNPKNSEKRHRIEPTKGNGNEKADIKNNQNTKNVDSNKPSITNPKTAEKVNDDKQSKTSSKEAKKQGTNNVKNLANAKNHGKQNHVATVKNTEKDSVSNAKKTGNGKSDKFNSVTNTKNAQKPNVATAKNSEKENIANAKNSKKDVANDKNKKQDKRKTFTVQDKTDNIKDTETLSYSEFKIPIDTNSKNSKNSTFNKNNDTKTTNSECSLSLNSKIPVLKTNKVVQSKFSTGNTYRFKVGNTGMKNLNGDTNKKGLSKIPQISLKDKSKMKMNLLRISPRLQKKPASRNK